MSRQKRTPGLGDAPLTRARGGARDRLRDAGSKELALLAKKVGNSEVGALLGAATDKRDALLAFVERRLTEIQMVQRAEQKEMGDQREWHLRVARGATGFTLPDPTRWRRSTLLYRRAAEALCAGDLARGAHLLDQAVTAERATWETVPAQVELPSALSAPTSTPEERPFVTEGETTPATKAPALFQRADTILRVTSTSDLVPVNRDNPTHHWWDVVEEEAEADKKKDEKKGTDGAGTAEAPALAERRAEAVREGAVRAGAVREVNVDEAPTRASADLAPVTEAAAPEAPAPRKGKKPLGR